MRNLAIFLENIDVNANIIVNFCLGHGDSTSFSFPSWRPYLVNNNNNNNNINNNNNNNNNKLHFIPQISI